MLPKGGTEDLSTHTFEQWRVRSGERIEYYATLGLAEQHGLPDAVVETRVATVTYTPWEDISTAQRLYWRDGSRVHLLGPGDRFLCGVKNSEHYMRVARAARSDLCGNCLRRL